MSCQCNQCKVKELEAKNAELEKCIDILINHDIAGYKEGINELEEKLRDSELAASVEAREADRAREKLEIAMSCTKNIRERLRSKSVSMRAFKIIDDEISKMKAAINGKNE